MKFHLASVVLISLLAACSPPPDHLGVVLEFQKHKNAGNLESVLALFADEPSLAFGPLGTIEGLAAVRGILEYDLALNTHLELIGCKEQGQEVSCRVAESNDWLKTAGIESITYDENRFLFASDGRIDSIRATLSAESGQLLGRAMAEFHQWATANRPAEYAKLFSEDGAFVYSGQNAKGVLALLRMWRAETSSAGRYSGPGSANLPIQSRTVPYQWIELSRVRIQWFSSG